MSHTELYFKKVLKRFFLRLRTSDTTLCYSTSILRFCLMLFLKQNLKFFKNKFIKSGQSEKNPSVF